jgi:hypothetical protein
MKINHKNVSVTIQTDKTIKEDFIQNQIADAKLMVNTDVEWVNNVPKEHYEEYIRDVYNNLMADDCKRFIITKSAREVIDRIKIDKVDIEMFANLPKYETWEFMISPDRVFRMMYDGHMLRGMVIWMEETPDKKGWWFKYHSTGYVLNHDEGVAVKEAVYRSEEVDEFLELWVRCLVFIQFSEPETVLLQAGRKYGTNRHNRIKNDSKSNYIVVNSRWNSTVIRGEGFTVSGHFRLQACGKGMKDRKLIYVDEFEKNGYVRRSGKETSNLSEA